MNNFEIIEKASVSPENMTEKSTERSFETITQPVEKSDTDNIQSVVSSIAIDPVYTPTEQEKKIENILEKDLEEEYKKMPRDLQIQFKKAGEETARKINIILQGAKVNLKKIVGLIREWLFLIPGVNKYFLEKEAKIKADEIIQSNNK